MSATDRRLRLAEGLQKDRADVIRLLGRATLVFTMFQALALGISASPIGPGDTGLVTSSAVVSDAIVVQAPKAIRSILDVAPVAVPESPSLILVGMGLVASARYLRRRRVGGS